MSAEQIRQAHEKVKQLRKKYIQNGIIVVVTGVVLILVLRSIAWFSSNVTTSATGMSSRTRSEMFELEVRGNYIENNDVSGSGLKIADPEYDDGESLNATTYQTSNDYTKIFWRKEGNTEEYGHYEEGLEPNAHGKLTFWVVPKIDGQLDIEFEFDLRGYIATYVDPDADEPIVKDLFEINDDLEVTAENGLKDADDLTSKRLSLEYAKGHILFFADYNSVTGYYSGFLGTGRKIRFGDCYNPDSNPKVKYNAGNPVTVVNGNKYKVTIYWKWANTFEQMALDETSPKADTNPLIVSTNTSDRLLMDDYLGNTTDNQIFRNLDTAEIAADIDIIEDSNSNASSFNTAVHELTNAYNNADSFIGRHLDYFLIEMSAHASQN